MKMTYQKFMELLQQDKEQREKLQSEIASLMEEESKLDAQMKTAADAGEVDNYLELSNQKDTVAKKIYVKRTFQDKRSPLVTETGATEAWNDYVGSYNKKLKAAIADYESEKQKLCSMYSDMVELQKNACATREILADAVSVPSSNFKMDTIPFVEYVSDIKDQAINYAMRLNGLIGVADPDVCYYLSNHVKKTGEKIMVYNAADLKSRSPEADRIINVVTKQKSK